MPGAGDHASRNHAWGLEQPSRAQVDREGADPWRNEWFANGYRRGRGDVVKRRWKRQRSGDGPRSRHPARHDGCLHGFGSIRCAGAIDAATIRCGSLHRIEHLPHHGNRYRRYGTHAGIGDGAGTLGRPEKSALHGSYIVRLGGGKVRYGSFGDISGPCAERSLEADIEMSCVNGAEEQGASKSTFPAME